MSEKIVRFLLSEIKTVRVICQKCKTIVEIPIEKLEPIFASGECRYCKQPFRSREVPLMDVLGAFGGALVLLQGMEDRVKVEIAMPAEERA